MGGLGILGAMMRLAPTWTLMTVSDDGGGKAAGQQLGMLVSLGTGGLGQTSQSSCAHGMNHVVPTGSAMVRWRDGVMAWEV